MNINNKCPITVKSETIQKSQKQKKIIYGLMELESRITPLVFLLQKTNLNLEYRAEIFNEIIIDLQEDIYFQCIFKNLKIDYTNELFLMAKYTHILLYSHYLKRMERLLTMIYNGKLDLEERINSLINFMNIFSLIIRKLPKNIK